MAGTEATHEGIGEKVLERTKLVSDNQGVISLAANLEYHSRTKHIHGGPRFISEIVEQKVIEGLWKWGKEAGATEE